MASFDCLLSQNIFAKYYENPTMLSRVIAKNIGDVFSETQCKKRANSKLKVQWCKVINVFM